MVRFASCQLCKGAVIRQSIGNTHICIRIWANSWIHRKIIEIMALEIWWTDSGPIGMRCLIKTHFDDIQFYGTIYWAPLGPYSRHSMIFLYECQNKYHVDFDNTNECSFISTQTQCSWIKFAMTRISIVFIWRIWSTYEGQSIEVIRDFVWLEILYGGFFSDNIFFIEINELLFNPFLKFFN